MCTVVVRWSRGVVVEVLALRDELVGREFDDPAANWPERPSVIGGRDRAAGGSWCVSDTRSGGTALVLNRPQKPVGTPSRGVLPLQAVAHGGDWPSHVPLAGMASFALVLAAPEALTVWMYDGEQLTSEELPPGTHMVTSGGAEDGKAARFLADFAAAPVLQWPALVGRQQPRDDPAALVVRHADENAVYATVFGQVSTARPGEVVLRWSRTPWVESSWIESAPGHPVPRPPER